MLLVRAAWPAKAPIRSDCDVLEGTERIDNGSSAVKMKCKGKTWNSLLRISEESRRPE